MNEPGEGSGVARGFYTALAEAVLTNTRLPNLDLAQAVASGSTASLTAAASKSMQFSLIQRLRGTRDPSRLGRSSSSTSGSGSKSSSSRTAREISRLSFDARSFVMNGKFQMIFLLIFRSCFLYLLKIELVHTLWIYLKNEVLSIFLCTLTFAIFVILSQRLVKTVFCSKNFFERFISKQDMLKSLVLNFFSFVTFYSPGSISCPNVLEY